MEIIIGAATTAPPHTTGGVGTLIVGALIVAGLWLAASVFWPYTACRKCQGTGTSKAPFGLGWRDCSRCRGRGRRVKAARRGYEIARGFDDE